MFGRKKAETRTYDREHQKPVIRASICNGEQVAGFRDLQTGRFEEVMALHSEADRKEFLRLYQLEESEVHKEY